MSTIHPEEQNFLRANRLLSRVAPKGVRLLFIKRNPGSNAILTQNLLKQKSELEKIRGFNKKNIPIIFPTSGNVDPNNFDLTLLIFLLRNFTKIPAPIDGWNVIPSFADSTEAADLLRIREARNKIAHTRDGKLNQIEFEKLWREMEIVLRRISNGSLDDEIKKLKTTIMNESDIENLESMHEKVEELDRIIQDPVPRNIRADIKEIMKSWKKDDMCYYETNLSRNISHAIETNDIIMITGSSGSGKTAALRHVALKYHSESYDILPVKSVEEIKRYHSEDIKQIYVIDDVVGVHSLESDLVRKWENLQEDLVRWKILPDQNFVEQSIDLKNQNLPKKSGNNSNNKNNCKILLSCRLHLTKMDLFPKFLLEIETINIQNKSNTFSYLERKNIFQKVYINLRKDSELFESSDLSEELVMRFDSFPLLCRMCAQGKSDPKAFFSLPFQYFSKEIENLYCNSSKLPYFALIFSLVFNGIFPKESESNKLEGFEQILDLCELDRTTSHEKIRKTLDSLKDIYLDKTSNNGFDFYHVIIRDIVAHHFCLKKGFKILAKYASDCFIRDRVRPNGILHLDNTEDSFLITLDDSVDRKHYILRICEDLFQKDWLITFTKPVFPNPLLENEIYFQLRESKMLQNILSRTNEMQPPNRISDIQEYNEFIAFLRDVPYKATFRDINHFREEILRPLPIVFWFIGFGWYQMFKNIYTHVTGSHIITVIKNSKHATLVLAALGDNAEMLKKIRQSIVKANKNCFICKKSAMSEKLFVHLCYCGIKHISSFTIACINGNLLMVNDLRDLLSYSSFTKLNVSVLENICEPKKGLLQPYFVTALDLACIFGHAKLVNEFLKEIKSKESIEKDEIQSLLQRLLYIASFEGHNAIVSMLLTQNEQIDINESDKQKRTALLAASGRGHADVVATLLSKHAEVNRCDVFGWTPLKVACAKGYLEIVTLLLEEDSLLIDYSEIDRLTSEKQEEMKKYINGLPSNLLRRMFVNCTTEAMLLVSYGYECFPLLLASLNGHHKIVQLLLSKNASVDRRIEFEGRSTTSLFAACCNGQERVVLELLGKGASLSQCEGGRTPLMYACSGKLLYATPISLFKETDKFSFNEANHLDVVKALVLKDPSQSFLNERDENGMSAFFYASSSENLDIMKFLLESKAKINARDNEGRTALWLACKYDCPRVVSFLLQNNADPNLCNKNGESPFWIACAKRHRLLIPNLAFRVFYSTSWIPWSHVEILNSLFSHDVDINACNNDGKSPLWIASSRGDDKLVSTLLSKGACTNKCDNEGISPFKAAMHSFSFGIAAEILWKKK